MPGRLVRPDRSVTSDDVAAHPDNSESRSIAVPNAVAMRQLGRELAGQLRAGDLVLLIGELGAGKTTLAQGIGAGLQVRGPITSPTFVIAKVHPPLSGGPPLVHVDAYRLGGWDELEDLDLEASMDEAVTVVEWGEGVAEGLAADRLEVHIAHEDGASTPVQDPDAVLDDDADLRRVTLTGVGSRWADLGPLSALTHSV